MTRTSLPIKYDLSNYGDDDWDVLKNCLKQFNVDWWIEGNNLCTDDKEKFNEALHYFVYGEEY